jgi:hypothetical protein
MPDREERARAREFEAIQEELEGPAPAPPVRNINHDVHEGYGVQRPHARLEDRMARTVGGWSSYEHLQSALEALPPGTGNELFRDEADGSWYRKVPRATGRTFVHKGKLVAEYVTERRNVALTQEAARAATQATTTGGPQTDYFNGFTWLRRGMKPEKDGNVVGAAAAVPEERWYEELGASDQAMARSDAARRDVAAPPVPALEEAADAGPRGKERK